MPAPSRCSCSLAAAPTPTRPEPPHPAAPALLQTHRSPGPAARTWRPAGESEQRLDRKGRAGRGRRLRECGRATGEVGVPPRRPPGTVSPSHSRRWKTSQQPGRQAHGATQSERAGEDRAVRATGGRSWPAFRSHFEDTLPARAPHPHHVSLAPAQPRAGQARAGAQESGPREGLVQGEPAGPGPALLPIPPRQYRYLPGGLALTRLPLDEPGWQSGGSWDSPLGTLLVPVLPPVPQLGVDEAPHEPGLGGTHQQQHAEPAGDRGPGSGGWGGHPAAPTPPPAPGRACQSPPSTLAGC